MVPDEALPEAEPADVEVSGGGSEGSDGGDGTVTAEHHEVPGWLFALELVYLVALLTVFVVYETSSGFRSALPDGLGALPIEVPWFGALGGTLISLTGIFDYSCRWNHCLRYWHYARPFVGAVLGSVGALLFFVLSDTAVAGSEPTTVNATVFDVVAFLVGYREQSFRELIKRATDLLLRPADTPPTTPPGATAPTATTTR
jgi:hypothetical protein